MSRIGKKVIPVPKGVEVKFDQGVIHVKGPKGVLKRELHEAVKADLEAGQIVVRQAIEGSQYRRFHGLSRTLVANMVEGVTNGYTKSLLLVGVGYRAAQQGKALNLSLGFSHPIVFEAPEGLELKVDKQTTIVVTGPSKELVGEVAAKIRGLKPPEPYHGKGVRYHDEVIQTKAGKAAGKSK